MKVSYKEYFEMYQDHLDDEEKRLAAFGALPKVVGDIVGEEEFLPYRKRREMVTLMIVSHSVMWYKPEEDGSLYDYIRFVVVSANRIMIEEHKKRAYYVMSGGKNFFKSVKDAMKATGDDAEEAVKLLGLSDCNRAAMLRISKEWEEV